MSSRRAQTWVWWLLPFLVARALLPIGFMPAAAEHSFKLVICSAGFAKTVETDSKQIDHSGTSQHGSLTCPFAQVSTFGLSFAMPVAAGVFLAALWLGFKRWREPRHTWSSYYSLARGPPAAL